MNVIAIYGRNEAKHIPISVPSHLAQGWKLYYFDDGSTDESVQLLKPFSIFLPEFELREGPYHESYKFSYKMSMSAQGALDCVLDHHFKKEPVEYFMISNADTKLALDYCDQILRAFERDPRLVIASGRITNERHLKRRMPAGAGRIYKMSYFLKWIGAYPYAYCWEMYPLYRALADGLNVAIVDKAEMQVLRPTVNKIENRGILFKEMAFHWYYALLIALRRGNMEIFTNFLRYRYVYDPGMEKTFWRYLKWRFFSKT